jgi:hypothetical protein
MAMRVNLRCEVFDQDRTPDGHMDFLLRPSRPVIWVHTKATPHFLAEVIRLLLRESLAHDNIAIFHEVINVIFYKAISEALSQKDIHCVRLRY